MWVVINPYHTQTAVGGIRCSSYTKIREGVMDGLKNLILVVSRIEEETVIKLNTWEYRNISGCLEERVVRKKVNLGTLYQTRGIVC